jgi:transcriptional regulator with XRE-family HTH domain
MKSRSGAWPWKDENQKREMEEEITVKNSGEKLRCICKITHMSQRDLANVLGVREYTISRLMNGKSYASEEFLNRLRALQVIGIAKFKKLSKEEKSSVAEKIGAGTGIGAGVGASIAAVSAAGSVFGLSAAGIASGLAAIGGSMVGGVALVATIPVAAGLLGYGVAKGIKKICEENRLKCEDLDDRWEITKDSSIGNDGK